MGNDYLTQRWDITDTCLSESSFSVAHSRDRNLCDASLEMQPRGVLGVAPQLGAGASS